MFGHRTTADVSVDAMYVFMEEIKIDPIFVKFIMFKRSLCDIEEKAIAKYQV